jgi:hypothetical protein
MALLATAATTGRAQWTNPWYSGWTNPAAGWPSFRYPKELRAAGVERQTVAGSLTNTIPTVLGWPSRKWLRITDAALEEMAPRFVDTNGLPQALTNGYPMWTFSNLCVAAGLTNGNFTRCGTNLPGWPNKRDLTERRAVVRLLTMTTNKWASSREVLGGGYEASIADVTNLTYETITNGIAAAEAIATNIVTDATPGFDYYKAMIAEARTRLDRKSVWNVPSPYGTFRACWSRAYSRRNATSAATNYASQVTFYASASYTNEGDQAAIAESWYVPAITYSDSDAVATNVTDWCGDDDAALRGQLPADPPFPDWANYWVGFPISKSLGGSNAVWTIGNTNLTTIPDWLVDQFVAQSWNTNSALAARGYAVGGTYNASTKNIELYPRSYTPADTTFFALYVTENWAVTNGFVYQ